MSFAPARAQAPLPDAPSPVGSDPAQPLKFPRHYRPDYAATRPRTLGKLSYGFASLVSPRVFVETFLIGGLPTLYPAPQAPVYTPGEDPVIYDEQFDIYGRLIDAWGDEEERNGIFHARRYAVGLATAESRQILSNLVLPFAFHQQAKYRPAAMDSDLSERMEHAAESLVVTYDDHDRVVPNYSKLIGTFTAAWLASHTYPTLAKAPELHTGRVFLKYSAYSLAGDLATNATRELLRAAVQPDWDVYVLHGRATEDSYYPLSLGAKTVRWLHSTYSGRVFAQAALTTSLFSFSDLPPEPNGDANTPILNQEYADFGQQLSQWRQQTENTAHYHARRLYAGLSTVETEQFLTNFAVPVFTGVDPRYIPLGRDYSAGERWQHTFTSLVTARTEDGGHSVNLPILVGTFGSALLAKEVYYPQLGVPALGSAKVFTATVGLNLLADVVGNVWCEFHSHSRGF